MVDGKKLNQTLTQLEQRIDRIEKRVNDRLGWLEQHFKALDERVIDIEQKEES